MKLRQVRTVEVKPGSYYLASWPERTFELLGPVFQDGDGGHYTSERPGLTPVPGLWVVRGPSGPMRVRTRALRLPVDAPAPTPPRPAS